MNYATLLEAYQEESFSKKGKKKTNIPVENDKINVEEYKKDFNHCEPLQPPHYKLPLSNKSIDEYNKAYETFLRERKINELHKSNNQENVIISNPNDNKANNKNNINIYENYDKIKLEQIDDIEPYIDEDLENYLNINDFKNSSYEVNDYVCGDTYKQDFMNKEYDLKTQDSLKFDKKDYGKIPRKNKVEYNEIANYSPLLETRNYHSPPSQYSEPMYKQRPRTYENRYQDDITEYPMMEREFNKTYKSNNIVNELKYENEMLKQKLNQQNTDVKIDTFTNSVNLNNNEVNTFYKNLINIGIFILIGVFLIFLIDLLTELALHKGMKQTVEILAPLLEELKTLRNR